MGDDSPAEPRTLQDLQREHGVVPGRLHSQAAEAAEQSPLRNYVRDLVLGYNDGLVSAFAATAGVAGAAFAAPQILVVGVAAATAGALSMAAGEYISTKSQAQFYASERALEREHLSRWPQLEQQELRESLAAKGIQPPLLESVTNQIASDPERFLDYMMRDEFGVGQESERSPTKAAVLILVAFLAGACLAVAPYALLPSDRGLAGSAAASLTGLFLAGVVRARASRLPVLRAGIEMMLVGGIAGAITYGIGSWIGTLG